MEEQQPYGRLIAAMQKQEQEDELFLAKVKTSLLELNLHNSIYAQTLVRLCKLLTEFSLMNTDDPVSELELDRDRGMSINIGTALRALHNYSAPLREGGEDKQMLEVAILAIFRELERRTLNEI